MTFGDFHHLDALEAVNRIFACAEPLISLEALNNNNADQNAVVVAASPSLTDSEIVEANEVFEDELEEIGMPPTERTIPMERMTSKVCKSER